MKTLRTAAMALASFGLLISAPSSALAAESCDTTSIVSGANTLLSDGSTAVPVEVSSYWATIPGATWVWETAFPSNPQSDESVSFHQDFRVDEKTDSGTLYIAADDLYSVQVNGVQIGATTEANTFMQIGTYDITDALVDGFNTITVTATNLSYGKTPSAAENPAGLSFRIDLKECGSSSSRGSSVSSRPRTSSATTTPSIPAVISNIKSGVAGLFLGTPEANADVLDGEIATGTATTSSTTPEKDLGSLLAGAGSLAALMPLYGWLALLLLLIAIAILVARMRSEKKY